MATHTNGNPTNVRTQLVSIQVLVDEDGSYVVGGEGDDIHELYDDKVGGSSENARRMINVELTVPLPVTVTLKGEVPPERSPEPKQLRVS